MTYYFSFRFSDTPSRDRAVHRLRDVGAHAGRTPVILVRAGEIEGVVAKAAAIDHAVLPRLKLARVEPVVRPVLAEPLGAQIDRHAERQDVVHAAEIDRDVLGQAVQRAEPSWLREV